ncbi:chromosome segregation protein SMC [Sorangium cellulosum]|uniref:Chromosome segregation protein SMC n=1 Tax=Sorangium cellulosum TaxID=56 RepID=A0A4V0NEN1_SORCE|nr:AAA family ATPase [Sorangium cellulosum]AUX26752.1 chromosome segregation protein SMC [Sorangium cellulosum]
MIRRLQIQGFKTATDVTLELGQLNVLIGANGAGKSNLLEALGALSCAAEGRVDQRTLQARGVRLGTPVLYRSALRAQKRLVEKITLEAETDGARYRVSLGNPATRGKSAWRYVSEELAERGEPVGRRSARGAHVFPRASGRRGAGAQPQKQPVEPGPRDGLGPIVRSVHGRGPLAELLEHLGGFAIYAPCTPMLRGQVADPAPPEPLGLLGGGLADCLFDLRETPQVYERARDEAFSLIDWATDVRFDASTGWAAAPPGVQPPSRLSLSLRDRHLIDDIGWISAREANEGALYVLFVFLLLLHPDAPRVLAIDGVDHSLNPWLIGGLIRRMQQIVLGERDRPQLLLTTQNPVVLDALDLRDDRVRLFTVTRTRSGATEVSRVEHDEALDRAEEKWMPLSYLWTSGSLGGMGGVPGL